jgi:hypothetical protein
MKANRKLIQGLSQKYNTKLNNIINPSGLLFPGKQ